MSGVELGGWRLKRIAKMAWDQRFWGIDMDMPKAPS